MRCHCSFASDSQVKAVAEMRLLHEATVKSNQQKQELEFQKKKMQLTSQLKDADDRLNALQHQQDIIRRKRQEASRRAKTVQDEALFRLRWHLPVSNASSRAFPHLTHVLLCSAPRSGTWWMILWILQPFCPRTASLVAQAASQAMCLTKAVEGASQGMHIYVRLRKVQENREPSEKHPGVVPVKQQSTSLQWNESSVQWWW